MSKEHEQADKLIKQYCVDTITVKLNKAIKAALIDNQNTIDALEPFTHFGVNIIKDEYNKHKAVQTILKSKLK